MTANIKTARDEIYSIFVTAWKNNADSQNVKVLFADVSSDVPVASSANSNPPPWVRISIQHTNSTQGSLSNDNGRRRWTRTGIVTVQIFTPYGTGLSLADNLAMIALGAFEGKATPSHVWFYNVRPEEIGQDGAWFQTNVYAEFTYDEVR